jgi:Raf kinase inhibitor-like YbhB/YbcL family protein
MAFRITSRVFKEGEMIPALYTCQGENVSPPLDWYEPPEDTYSFALICDDPDAPGRTFVHWVIYNIPVGYNTLPEAIPAITSLPNGTKQGTNDFGQIGYGGPCPPSGAHRYFFKLFALDGMLNLDAGATKAELEKTMKRRIIQQVEMIGKYQKK